MKVVQISIYVGAQYSPDWLLDLELIDILKIKLNPILLGAGIPLFGNTVKSLRLDLMEIKKF